MNVVETPFSLKHTNVSRPQLSHSDSKQSIAASEGYYSLAENSSSEGDDRSKHTPARYHTPPSRNSPSPHHEQYQQETENPVTSLKGVGIPRHPQPTTNDRLPSPTVSTIAEERPETQEGKRSQHRGDMDSESLATTPGMDNTPYIRFAIDQLTRDEEVRGSRMYPVHEEVDYPVERIVSDDGLGYMDREQERERSMSRPPQQPRPPPVPRADSAVQRDIFVPFRPAPGSSHVLHFLPTILRPLWLLIFVFLCLLMLAGLIFCAVYSKRSNEIGLWDYVAFGDSHYFVFRYLPQLIGMVLLLWLLQIQIALQRVAPFISMASDSSRQRSGATFLQLYPTQFLVPSLEHFRAGNPLLGICYIIFWLFLWTIPLLSSSFNAAYIYDGINHWRWLAVQGVIWTVVALYILLILALLYLVIFLRRQTGLRWDPRSLADIIAMLERSNIVGDYSGSETFQSNDFRSRLYGRADRIGYWTTTKRPNDVFYGIGEEGGSVRRYSLEHGMIREKGPERSDYPDPTLQGTQQPGDFSIRMDIRSAGVRLKYLPWYLRDSAVILWIVISVALFVAWLVVSFVNSAVKLGFLPEVFARATQGGFSASNFLYSFIPALIGHILFLVILTFDHSLRALRPYISLSSQGGATAENSLLLDYSCRMPISVTLAAIINRHFQVAILSLVSLCSATLPILAGGCFWSQTFSENSTNDVVRVSAELAGYYSICFFLALYTVSLFALLPSRRRGALPHRSSTLSEIISWVYQSPILTDRAFARPRTKAELVTRLMGSAYQDRTFAQSLTSLIRPSRSNLRDDSPTDPALQNEKAKGKQRSRGNTLHDSMDPEKRVSVLNPGQIRYGFGIHVGRDGLEHLGIDRVQRGGERSGRELVIWEEQRRGSV